MSQNTDSSSENENLNFDRGNSQSRSQAEPSRKIDYQATQETLKHFDALKQRAGKGTIEVNDRLETSHETDFEKPIKTQASSLKKKVKRQGQQFCKLLEQPYTRRVGTRLEHKSIVL